MDSGNKWAGAFRDEVASLSGQIQAAKLKSEQSRLALISDIPPHLAAGSQFELARLTVSLDQLEQQFLEKCRLLGAEQRAHESLKLRYEELAAHAIDLEDEVAAARQETALRHTLAKELAETGRQMSEARVGLNAALSEQSGEPRA